MKLSLQSNSLFFSLSGDETSEMMKNRKNDHIRICATENVESRGEPFSKFILTPQALPEINFNDVNLHQTFLGRTFSLPFFITGMTGGVGEGQRINEILAIAAEKENIPLGLGSQKIFLKDKKYKNLFDVKTVAPNVFVIGNLGAVTLNYGVTTNDILKMIDDLKCDSLALHLNALQECIQPEGERQFANLLPKIKELVKFSPVPILVKEVGSGISRNTFETLSETGVAGIDIGGSGGTSWSVIEGLRGTNEDNRLGELFRNWGLRTDDSLLECAQAKIKNNLSVELTATGGIRNGLQVAKAIALGASMVGVGLPFFRAVVEQLTPSNDVKNQQYSEEKALDALLKEMAFFKRSLQIALFCCGAKNISELKKIEVRRDSL